MVERAHKASAYNRIRMRSCVSVYACEWLPVGKDASVDAQGLQQLMTDYFSSKHQ